MKITVIPVGMLGTNCYLLASGKGGCAVIDPGAQGEKIADVIKEQKLIPKYILLTHGHHDHIGAVKELQALYPEAKLYIGERDVELIADPQKSHASTFGNPKYLITTATPLHEGEELELDDLTIRVVETPGHTRGGVCFLVEDVMFSGDTLFLDDIGRCDLYGGDYGVMKKTLKKLAALPGNYTVYPGHGDATNLDYERRNNRYINE